MLSNFLFNLKSVQSGSASMKDMKNNLNQTSESHSGDILPDGCFIFNIANHKPDALRFSIESLDVDVSKNGSMLKSNNNVKNTNSSINSLKLVSNLPQVDVSKDNIINLANAKFDNFNELVESLVNLVNKNTAVRNAILQLPNGNEVPLGKYVSSQLHMLSNKVNLEKSSSIAKNVSSQSAGNSNIATIVEDSSIESSIIDLGQVDEEVYTEFEGVQSERGALFAPYNSGNNSVVVGSVNNEININHKSSIVSVSVNAKEVASTFNSFEVAVVDAFMDVLENIENNIDVELNIENIIKQSIEKVDIIQNSNLVVMKTIAKQVIKSAQNFEKDTNKLKIELAPKGLGEIEITMEQDDEGFVRAVIKSDNASVLEMLRNDKNAFLELMKNGGLDYFNSNLEFEHKNNSNQENTADEVDYKEDDETLTKELGNIIENNKIDILT